MFLWKKEFVSGVVVLYCVALYVVSFDHVHCTCTCYCDVYTCTCISFYVHVCSYYGAIGTTLCYMYILDSW